MKSNKEIPKTNYFILVALIVLVISICTATYNIYSIYKENKKNLISPLNTNHVVDVGELTSTTVEMQEDSFLVISYTGDEDIIENEKILKILFRKYDLLDNIIYVDVTEQMEDEEFISDLNNTLRLSGDLEIKSLPTIVYFKQGVPTAIVKTKNGIVDSKSLETIIENNINVG